MTEHLTFIVSDSDGARRLDRYLAEYVPQLSRSQLQRLVRQNMVLLNGSHARPADTVAAGDTVAVTLPDEVDSTTPIAVADLPLHVLHADESVVVVDKPAGQVVHPAAGHSDDTLVNALIARFPELAAASDDLRPGIVHRLDRETSGVMVVALTSESAEHLRAQFQARTVEKVYLALVRGRAEPPEGIIEAPIGRDPTRRMRMAAVADGRPSRTVYRTLDVAADHSWLEIRPETGRTHQIRVHLAAIGHPVVSDEVYGRRDPVVGRTALHASQLGFEHPGLAARVRYEAPLPTDLLDALSELGLSQD